ncbi:D-glycero-beta-D-manno-heptose-7-phosphate kinase [Sneathiella sp. P13V-1]|uniref:D-glycero-beta-D-manno-heptose-7-phosphate kinase n=1 Tax=Sneathiella sp. P13V-1 TaxID=2697366 RepID=UPI00187B5BA1|nr:D-glycero-beta-D-manno-heptose-7-phosphate kinase [Sneathiella sp. P13V-1]MBE7636055.1 D-glycero-beta-D-manno-heptose-7-phosphate kinase [Sneathiella sp. P13V-1]
MSELDPRQLSSIVNKFKDVHVLCLGDVMLDRFTYGSAGRISPEAPIPVLSISHQQSMLGGAGNVVRNILSLGGKATLVAVVGDDAEGREIQHLLEKEEGITPALVTSKGRPTTVKTRFIADGQQLLRADAEASHPVTKPTAVGLVDNFKAALNKVQMVILSDYAKGVLSDEVLKEVIAAANEAGVPVVADPKSEDFSRYQGVDLLTPNRKEMIAAAGMPCDTNSDVVAAARSVMSRDNIKALLVTRSEAGMSLISEADETHVAAQAQEVFDVSGAGDSVIACLSLGIGAGASHGEAAYLANLAGGVVVAKQGTAAVTADEIEAALHNVEVREADNKITSLTHAKDIVDGWRARGLKVGFTNGCFDLVHPGHISLIRQARAECDRLIVGLNTDDSIRRLKGPDRPATNETSRAIVLAGLEDVSLVVPFAEDTPINLIEGLKPDVLVKGADYTVETVVGSDIVQAYGGRVLLAELKEGFSTTRTIQRLLETDRKKFANDDS